MGTYSSHNLFIINQPCVVGHQEHNNASAIHSIKLLWILGQTGFITRNLAELNQMDQNSTDPCKADKGQAGEV